MVVMDVEGAEVELFAESMTDIFSNHRESALMRFRYNGFPDRRHAAAWC